MAFGLEACHHVAGSLVVAVAEGSNADARRQLACASLTAGLSMNLSDCAADQPDECEASDPPLTPLPAAPAVASDVANAALYLISDESRFVTGSEIKIDGGISAM